MTHLTKFIVAFFALILLRTGVAQTPGNWVWVHGTNILSDPGVFGTKGVSSPSNNPPALYEACSWTDLQGNFWLFGGDNSMQDFNAMWKFNTTTKEWTWMHGPSTPAGFGVYGTKGIPSPANIPGARAWGVSTWIDLQGNFWMYGGYGADVNGGTGTLNDLWKFDPLTLQWTWMSGSNTTGSPAVYGTMGVANSANTPPPFMENHICWVDSGNNLWLYGGEDMSYSTNDDLWKFSISTSQWTWVRGSGGSSTTLPAYGPIGVEGPSYTPGSRFGYTSFTDPVGHLFLFGGGTTSSTYQNDVWRYNPTNNQWAYWGGTTFPSNAGSYISKCDTITSNYPEGLMEMRATWPDSCGFWVFGGFQSSYSCLNNLWYFNSDSKKFTWATGSNIPNETGNYGTQNISATTNQPPARCGAVTWNDKSGNLWMFGGLTMNPTGYYNDLWMYTPDPACIPLCSRSVFNTGLNANFSGGGSACGSLTVSFSAAYNNAAAYSWNFGDGVGTSVSQNPTYTYNNPGSYSVTLIVTDTTGAKDTLVKPAIVNIYSSANAAFTASPLYGCLPYSVYFQNNSTNATSYFWDFGNSNTSTTVSPSLTCTTTDPYNVLLIAYGPNNCNDTTSSTIIVTNACETLFIPNVFTPDGQGPSDNDEFKVVAEGFLDYGIEIFDRWGLKVFETTDNHTYWNGKKMNKGAASAEGTYYYIITIKSHSNETKKYTGFLTLLRK